MASVSDKVQSTRMDDWVEALSEKDARSITNLLDEKHLIKLHIRSLRKDRTNFESKARSTQLQAMGFLINLVDDQARKFPEYAKEDASLPCDDDLTQRNLDKVKRDVIQTPDKVRSLHNWLVKGEDLPSKFWFLMGPRDSSKTLPVWWSGFHHDYEMDGLQSALDVFKGYIDWQTIVASAADEMPSGNVLDLMTTACGPKASEAFWDSYSKLFTISGIHRAKFPTTAVLILNKDTKLDRRPKSWRFFQNSFLFRTELGVIVDTYVQKGYEAPNLLIVNFKKNGDHLKQLISEKFPNHFPVEKITVKDASGLLDKKAHKTFEMEQRWKRKEDAQGHWRRAGRRVSILNRMWSIDDSMFTESKVAATEPKA